MARRKSLRQRSREHRARQHREDRREILKKVPKLRKVKGGRGR